jgi:hypothetical protein
MALGGTRQGPVRPSLRAQRCGSLAYRALIGLVVEEANHSSASSGASSSIYLPTYVLRRGGRRRSPSLDDLAQGHRCRLATSTHMPRVERRVGASLWAEGRRFSVTRVAPSRTANHNRRDSRDATAHARRSAGDPLAGPGGQAAATLSAHRAPFGCGTGRASRRRMSQWQSGRSGAASKPRLTRPHVGGPKGPAVPGALPIRVRPEVVRLRPEPRLGQGVDLGLFGPRVSRVEAVLNVARKVDQELSDLSPHHGVGAAVLPRVAGASFVAGPWVRSPCGVRTSSKSPVAMRERSRSGLGAELALHAKGDWSSWVRSVRASHASYSSSLHPLSTVRMRKTSGDITV